MSEKSSSPFVTDFNGTLNIPGIIYLESMQYMQENSFSQVLMHPAGEQPWLREAAEWNCCIFLFCSIALVRVS